MFEEKSKGQVLVSLCSFALHPGGSLEVVAGKGVVSGCCPEQGQALLLLW